MTKNLHGARAEADAAFVAALAAAWCDATRRFLASLPALPELPEPPVDATEEEFEAWSLEQERLLESLGANVAAAGGVDARPLSAQEREDLRVDDVVACIGRASFAHGVELVHAIEASPRFDASLRERLGEGPVAALYAAHGLTLFGAVPAFGEGSGVESLADGLGIGLLTPLDEPSDHDHRADLDEGDGTTLATPGNLLLEGPCELAVVVLERAAEYVRDDEEDHTLPMFLYALGEFLAYHQETGEAALTAAASRHLALARAILFTPRDFFDGGGDDPLVQRLARVHAALGGGR